MRLAIVFWVSLACATVPAAAQRSYSEQQLALASQIGAAVELSRRCGVFQLDQPGVMLAMVSLGLGPADLREGAGFRAEVQKRQSVLRDLATMRQRRGASEFELRVEACDQVDRMYGRRGYVRAGLAREK